ncbi:SprT family zinc-dependent metalloprotease [Thalassolituus sp.]|jgi:predicted metal-dependent hydrolase|uniref:M48 family metallopeptidase n=1 Tax=Thalassolituus sp. TaxID=2030822 RepID=UPI0032D8C29C
MPMLKVGDLSMDVYRKDIKNLHISVMPPEGRVRLSVPEKMTDTALRMAVISRIPWIRKQQKSFTDQPRQSKREMVSGESHYLWGRHYRLEIIETTGKHGVSIGGRKLRMTINPATTQDNRIKLLNEFYRSLLKERLEEISPDWIKEIGVAPSCISVKRMKTKWGSCNTSSKRILLNLDLARKAPECLEFILVHELIHLHERHHNERFKALMNKYLPDWRERRSLLNSSPLAHDYWAY